MTNLFPQPGAAEILQDLTDRYAELTGAAPEPASVEWLLARWMAAALVPAYNKLRFCALQNLPGTATGEYLDALCEQYGLPRPAAAKAMTTEQFFISAARPDNITIPAGTRVTNAARTAYFSLREDAVIPAGQTHVDALVECESAGGAGNGYAVGSLCILVDPYDWCGSVSNTEVSYGGADGATDAEYRALFKAAQNAVSTAGPIGSYEYLAKSVSNDIADVLVMQPMVSQTVTLPIIGRVGMLVCDDLSPATVTIPDAERNVDYTMTYVNNVLTIRTIVGHELEDNEEVAVTFLRKGVSRVTIYAVTKDGAPAGSDLKAAIAARCSADSARPMADAVTVGDPMPVNFDVDFEYWASADATESSEAIQAAVDEAVDRYINWQTTKIGRDINPSVLMMYVMQTGKVKRVQISEPHYLLLRNGEDGQTPKLAALHTRSVSYGGREGD